MDKWEKVIYSIERCTCHVPDACRDCGYDNEPYPKCFEHLLRDAVPLDKLCEWLGEQGMLALCFFDQDCDDCELKKYWRNKKSECWKHVLTKWMEEQDAPD